MVNSWTCKAAWQAVYTCACHPATERGPWNLQNSCPLSTLGHAACKCAAPTPLSGAACLSIGSCVLVFSLRCCTSHTGHGERRRWWWREGEMAMNRTSTEREEEDGPASRQRPEVARPHQLKRLLASRRSDEYDSLGSVSSRLAPLAGCSSFHCPSCASPLTRASSTRSS